MKTNRLHIKKGLNVANLILLAFSLGLTFFCWNSIPGIWAYIYVYTHLLFISFTIWCLVGDRIQWLSSLIHGFVLPLKVTTALLPVIGYIVNHLLIAGFIFGLLFGGYLLTDLFFHWDITLYQILYLGIISAVLLALYFPCRWVHLLLPKRIKNIVIPVFGNGYNPTLFYVLAGFYVIIYLFREHFILLEEIQRIPTIFYFNCLFLLGILRLKNMVKLPSFSMIGKKYNLILVLFGLERKRN